MKKKENNFGIIFIVIAILIIIASSFFIDGLKIGHTVINKGWRIQDSLPIDVKIINIDREDKFTGDIVMESWSEEINGVYVLLSVYSLDNCREGSLIESAGNPESTINFLKGEARKSKVELQFQEIVRGLKVEVRVADENAELLGESKCYKVKE